MVQCLPAAIGILLLEIATKQSRLNWIIPRQVLIKCSDGAEHDGCHLTPSVQRRAGELPTASACADDVRATLRPARLLQCVARPPLHDLAIASANMAGH